MAKTLRHATLAILALCAMLLACGRTTEPSSVSRDAGVAHHLGAIARVPPYAQLLVSRNGGQPTPGPQNIAVNPGDVLTFSPGSSAGVTQWLWEIVDYPPGMSLPAGWSWEGVAYASPMMVAGTFAPPNVTVPTQGPNNWGKISPKLTVNGNPIQYFPSGAQNQGFNANLSDSSTLLYLPSPIGLEGLAFQESTQGDSYRAWQGTIMRNLRTIGSGGAGSLTPPPSVLTSNTTLGASNQQVWANTSGGPFTVTLPFPAPIAAGARIATSDTGASFSTTHYLTLSGGGTPILLPTNDPITGALAGTLQSFFHETVASESLSFALVPNDPTLGTYWLTVGDGVNSYSAIGGVYVASTPALLRSLAPFTQWVPANTNAGSFTITLPGLPLTIQVMTTDTGNSFSVSKPLVICASGGATLLLPANDPVSGFAQGTRQTCFHQTVAMSSYAWQFIVGDPTFVTPYWLAI